MRPNILFVSLPSLPMHHIKDSFENKNVLSQALAMPLGLLYISSYLKAHCNVGEVKLLDYPCLLNKIRQYNNVEDFIECEAKNISDFTPDIIAYSLIFSSSHPFFEIVVKTLKEMWPKSISVVGGVHATNAAPFIFENISVDYLIKGEGEISFSDFVLQYSDEKSISVKGILSRGEWEENKDWPNSDFAVNLDDLPFPDWELVDINKYLVASGRRRSIGEATTKKFASVMTTRGCPNKCTFCSSFTVHGRKPRYRSVENIVQEISVLHERYGVNLISPEDDLFTANKKRVLSLLDAIKKLGIDGMEFQFPDGLNINSMDDTILDALEGCGMNVVTFAIESGSPYTQKHIIKKNCNLEKAITLVELCRARGFIVRAYFICGFPGETKELIDETVRYMKQLKADWSVIMIATPLVGTEMYEQFVEMGCIENTSKTWGYTSFQHRYFDTPEISADELNELVYSVNLDVNFVNNPNLSEGKYDRALSLFGDIAMLYPFHIFAHYGIYLAQKGNGNLQEAESTREEILRLISTDERARKMHDNYGHLIKGLC